MSNEIFNCIKCGAPAKCLDWDFNMRYQVMCDNNHTLGAGKFNEWSDAVSHWNAARQNKPCERCQSAGLGSLAIVQNDQGDFCLDCWRDSRKL